MYKLSAKSRQCKRTLRYIHTEFIHEYDYAVLFALMPTIYIRLMGSNQQ